MPTILPPGAVVVPPIAITPSSISYGRTVRYKQWKLAVGDVCHFQASADGATWKEMRHYPIGPDAFIRPGQTPAFPNNGVNWVMEEILSAPQRLVRCVNYKDTPVAQRPVLA